MSKDIYRKIHTCGWNALLNDYFIVYFVELYSYCIKTFDCSLLKQFHFTFNFTYNEQSIFKLCAMD